MNGTKKVFLVTEKEQKLLEELRKIRFAKDIPITVVEGEPTEIGEHKEVKRL